MESLENLLKFQLGNAKFDHHKFSLPAGHACPFALECFQKADRETGQITRGEEQVFGCFATNSEAMFPNTRNARWHNFELLRAIKDIYEMVSLIEVSMPEAKVMRIHESGDFFNQLYFDAWLVVARQNPETIFYAYTKSIPYWVKRLGTIPSNFKLTASRGGRHDKLIKEHNLKEAVVVFSPEQAEEMGLQIEQGKDELAYMQDDSFALLIHGTQKAGSEASKALQNLKKRGIKSGYSKK